MEGHKRMHIGFHLPIGKGLEHAYREAEHLGCEVVQVFLKNPRGWAQKVWTDRDHEVFDRLFRDLPVVAHLSYLPNIAKADEEPKNRNGLLHEAELCAGLGIARMVVHCGSRADTRKGIETAAWSVKEVLDRYPISLLLENSAGQGNVIGKNMEELAQIFEAIGDADRVGFCLDTAHLFESGYDVRRRPVWKSITDGLERRCGQGCIRFFHLNDSKTPLGSNVDRHWHIGKGEIGLRCFRYLINEKRFAHLGGVMETPKMGNMDEENMKTMKSLLSPLVSGSLS
jgi:deoxyribonuclease IV